MQKKVNFNISNFTIWYILKKHQLNGLFLRGFDNDCNPFCVTFSLTKVKGFNTDGLTN